MNIKIRVKNEEHSKAIQTRLFELGYEWGLRGKKLYFTSMDFIFAYCEDMSISYVNSRVYFEAHENKEVTLGDLYDVYEVKEYTMNKQQLVELIKEHFSNKNNTIDLSDMDLEDYDVDLSGLKANWINNRHQEAKEWIYNTYQQANGINNSDQEAKSINNSYQEANWIYNRHQEANWIDNSDQGINKDKSPDEIWSSLTDEQK